MGKIEIECSFCQAVLRVDSRHGGKQARCPGCGGLTLIPGNSSNDNIAVPAPPAADLPFQETYYRDSSFVDESESRNDKTYFPPGAEEPAPPVYTSTNSPTGDTGRPSVAPNRGYQPGDSAPLYADRYVINDDGRPGSGSIAAGIVSLGLILLCLPTIPTCFCISPFLLLTANSISRSAPHTLRKFAFTGVLVVGGLWVIRMLILFLFILNGLV